VATRQLTVDVDGIVTGIRIEATTPPRMIVEGVLQDTLTKATVKSFSEDVTDILPPAAKTAVQTLVTRAQAWIDSKT
jgi:hypothetical protein